MNKTYLKNILRDIKNTKGKVLSIAIMVALAASVVVGLLMTGPTMRLSLDDSLNTYKHPDIIVNSTYGLDYEDKIILENDKDIKNIVFLKSADVMKDDNLIRVKSYNEIIPKSVIVEGRAPDNSDEIMLDHDLKDKYKIGDKVKFNYLDNSNAIDEKPLSNLNYRIVGFFKTSDHFMQEMKEVSIAAKKEIDGYAYVLENNFSTDKYSEANIIYKDTDKLDKTSRQYQDYVKDKKNSIEERIKNRPGEVLNEIKEDTSEDLDKAQDEIYNAKKELSEAKDKLDKARTDLDKGYEDYQKGKETFNKEISDAKKELEDSRLILIDGQRKLDQGKNEYQKNQNSFYSEITAGQKEIVKNESELEEAQAQINKSREEINNGYDELSKKYNDSLNELNALKENLDNTNADLLRREEEYNNLVQNNENQTEDNSLKEIESRANSEELSSPTSANVDSQTLTKMRAELDNAWKMYNEGLIEYEKNLGILNSTNEEEKARLDQGLEEINNRQKEVDKGLSEIKVARDELENNRISAQKELDDALALINNNQADINNGWTKYNEGIAKLHKEESEGAKKLEDSYKKLSDGEIEYQKNLKKYEDNYDNAIKDIKKGEEDVEQGKKVLVKLVDPKYNVETIYKNKGIDAYYQNSLNMDELSKIFPTFFYLVAMLVTLTTMKRYIEEQRLINGIFKSLGYSDKEISKRFYIYGILPTFLGSLFGALFGKFVLLKVIFDAYSSGFNILNMDSTNPLIYMAFSIMISVLLIGLTIYMTSRETVNETPAALLLAKTPNTGSRIFLERIKPLWKRLSFMQKITARNIFRYKSRMFMTLFGVGGCTALIFFGFAMIDSLKDTATIGQKELNHYDIIAVYDENADSKDKDNYKKAVDKFDNLSINLSDATLSLDNVDRDIDIVIPDNSEKFKDFVTLRSPKRESIDIDKSKAVITEAIANDLKIKIGDSIELTFDNKTVRLPITDISENYTGDYIYISKDNFKDITGIDPKMNAGYIRGDSEDIVKAIEEEKAVSAIINTSKAYLSIDSLLDNLNIVIVLITLISSLLALIVLFNLISINVSERKRELATTKVLGFYPKEITSYIFREIFILTILGIIIGYGLGILIFRYIISVVAPSEIMLSYRLHPKPFIYSALITLVISFIMLVYTHKNLEKIDMAEAMSSGE